MGRLLTENSETKPFHSGPDVYCVPTTYLSYKYDIMFKCDSSIEFSNSGPDNIE